MNKPFWKVVFTTKSEKTFFKLEVKVQKQIQGYLRTKIATSMNPRRLGKPLSGKLSGFWRYRVGDYRLICSIQDDELIVLMVTIGHRKDIYH
ncbi:type II toxin-antitoxin system RelE family toxin [Candidatus Nucleicultrix amoebiphila]|uniref:Translation repressor RelE n=1 Tax=Candidatus Nucleicultrix amoebiphila FS5 TaxID=1414854 RepID=A0A1W6N3B5_9PROT|nr:type II toxin-antitoxin system RelE/ParE family toxin [Candidatus Nucleicultrix amoebiphila]ARN84312.1 hypothetical protein GQ61_02015 [Candidatus Nucleicultrix amoebiphila FS5]